MAGRVALIGGSSFMAQAMQGGGIGKDWAFLSHREALAGGDWAQGVDCVINFAYAPEMRKSPYSADLDVDSKIAQQIAGGKAHYIMLSSRMVYGHPDGAEILREDLTPAPENIYGQNKRRVEESLFEILGERRVTALRLSNIFGFEPQRASFFGMALTRLKNEGKIVYDMNPFVKRDFLSVCRFGKALEGIAHAPKGGIYNLGAGFGVETGLIAQWIIEGFGGGALHIENMLRRDVFWLDMSKTYQVFDIPKVSMDDVRADCVECGRRMKEVVA